jgi:hypothetical protein
VPTVNTTVTPPRTDLGLTGTGLGVVRFDAGQPVFGYAGEESPAGAAKPLKSAKAIKPTTLVPPAPAAPRKR